jgi:hypothetical protein
MSDTPLMSKMDALLKKHRGGAENNNAVPPGHTPTQPATQAAPPGAWLPVLTDVIQRGTPPVAAALVASPPTPAPPPVEPEAPAAAMPPAVVTDTLAEQLMSELAPRLSEVMEKQVAAELRKNLDQTVASLLSQLDVNVREIVRDAVAEKLRQPRNPAS